MALIQPQKIMENYGKEFEGILTLVNYNRTRNLSIVLFCANIVFFITDYIDKSCGLWKSDEGYKALFYSHVALGVITLIYILLSYKLEVDSAEDITLSHKIYVIVYALLMLILTAVISGWIDQKMHGQITVYVIGCLVLAVLYYLKPVVTAPLYGLSFILFLLCVVFSQKDPMIREEHYVNASLIIVLSYFLSVVLYKFKQQELIHKYYLEDLVDERTKELQATNDLLKQEIIEREKAEVEIARLDRLNLIGEMAASISHEVRNPMTTVKGFLQLLKKKQESKDQEYFELMIEELDRANSILTEFLSISRKRPTLFERQNLNELINSTLPLIQAEAQNNDKIVNVELNNLPDFQLNVQEIRQLLLNLVRNGFEAMSSGGLLTIKTHFSQNGEVVLMVADEGKGIDQELLEKIGTPFFTTKEKGTGLGLAVCYGIVARHNGRIRVETSSQGSKFNVHFALSKPERE